MDLTFEKKYLSLFQTIIYEAFDNVNSNYVISVDYFNRFKILDIVNNLKHENFSDEKIYEYLKTIVSDYINKTSSGNDEFTKRRDFNNWSNNNIFSLLNYRIKTPVKFNGICQNDSELAYLYKTKYYNFNEECLNRVVATIADCYFKNEQFKLNLTNQYDKYLNIPVPKIISFHSRLLEILIPKAFKHFKRCTKKKVSTYDKMFLALYLDIIFKIINTTFYDKDVVLKNINIVYKLSDVYTNVFNTLSDLEINRCVYNPNILNYDSLPVNIKIKKYMLLPGNVKLNASSIHRHVNTTQAIIIESEINNILCKIKINND